MEDQELQPGVFTGLVVPPQPIGATDFVHGDPANPLGNLGAQVLLDSADYTGYIPFPQRQSRPGVYDTMDCTGFGYCRRLATHLNCLWKLGRLSSGFVDWAMRKGYIQTDNTGAQSFMFDPQVLGIMAGTNGNGNWLQVVAETARKNGLAPAGTLPGVDAYNNLNSYYGEKISDSVRALCKEFLTWIDLPYQWTGALTEADALKVCPLYVALCTCGGWSQDHPVKWCNAGNNTNHCVGEVKFQEILDSYPSYLKTLTADYTIPYAMQVLVTQLQGNDMQTLGFQLAGSPTIYIEVGNALVAVADWQAFVNLGGSSNSVITLTQDQFSKFTVVAHDLFKSQ